MKPVSELLRRRDGVADGAPNTTLWHVRPDDTVFAALETLARHEVGALVVMDGAQMVGILSERDYTRKVALLGRNSRETRVAEIMTRGVITVSPRSGTHECMAVMRDRKIRHLPVVEDGTVLGMISIRDLMDDIIAEHEATIAQLETYISS